MSKESEEYRLEQLRRLEHKYRQAKPAKILEAEEAIAKYREEQEDAGPQIARASLPLPKPNQCPRCWIMKGRESIMYPIPHPEPNRFDRWKCRECEFLEDRPA